MILDNNKKSGLIINLIINVLSNIVLRVTQIIQGILVANILGPTQFGIKNAIQIIIDYGRYSHFGVLDFFYKIRSSSITETERLELYENVFSFLFFMGVFVAIIGLVLAIFLNYSSYIRLSILFAGLSIGLTFIILFYYLILQSNQDFSNVAKINIVQGVITFLLIIFFVYYFGILGYFIGFLVSTILILIYIQNMAGIMPKIKFDYLQILSLIKSSFYLFVLTFSFTVILSVDRIFITFFYDKTSLGYYTIGLFFSGIIYFVLSILFAPIIPNIYKLKQLTLVDLIKYTMKSNNIIYRGLYYLAVLIVFISPFFIFVLPKYGPGLVYINILCFSTIYMPYLMNAYFIAKHKEKEFIYVTILFILLALVFDFIIFAFNFGIIYIAFVTLIVVFVYGNTINMFGYKDILGSWSLAIKEVFNYLWPLGYALIGYGLLWLLAHYWLYDIMNYYVAKIVQAILFTLWYSPILWKIEKEHKIWKMVWDYLKGKMKKTNIISEQKLDTI